MIRRRSLLGISSAEYIKDSLTLWYDGIQNTRQGHNPNAITWEDLSGNNIDGELVGDVTYKDNLYKVNTTISNISYIKVDNQQILFSTVNDFSLQILFKTSQVANIAGTIEGDTRIDIWSNSQTEFNARLLGTRFPSSGSYTVDLSNLILFTATYNSKNQQLKYYLDNLEVYQGTASVTGSRYGLTIGSRTGATPKNALSEYSAIRYYSKELSFDEVVLNYQTDKRRYKF